VAIVGRCEVILASEFLIFFLCQREKENQEVQKRKSVQRKLDKKKKKNLGIERCLALSGHILWPLVL